MCLSLGLPRERVNNHEFANAVFIFSAICVLNASYLKPLLLGQVHAPIKKNNHSTRKRNRSSANDSGVRKINPYPLNLKNRERVEVA